MRESNRRALQAIITPVSKSIQMLVFDLRVIPSL
jgi:hypothetical protein